MEINKLTYLCLIFADLALVMGIVILVLPNKWKVGGLNIDPWPLFASFGIGWVVSVLHVYNTLTYNALFAVFWTCFPIILVAAQLKGKYDAGSSNCKTNTSKINTD